MMCMQRKSTPRWKTCVWNRKEWDKTMVIDIELRKSCQSKISIGLALGRTRQQAKAIKGHQAKAISHLILKKNLETSNNFWALRPNLKDTWAELSPAKFDCRQSFTRLPCIRTKWIERKMHGIMTSLCIRTFNEWHVTKGSSNQMTRIYLLYKINLKSTHYNQNLI